MKLAENRSERSHAHGRRHPAQPDHSRVVGLLPTYEDEVKSWVWVILGVEGRLGGISPSRLICV